MAGEFEFLENVDELNKTLREETVEAVEARDTFENVQTNILRDTTAEAAVHAETVSRVASDQNDELESMVQNFDRINEIDNSFGLRLIESVTFGFAPNFDRTHLRKEVGASQTRIQLQDARVSTQQKTFAANQSVRGATLNEARGKLLPELADVEDARQQIADTQTARRLQIQEEALALESLPVDQLQKAVKAGRFTEPQFQQEARRREGQILSIKSQRAAIKSRDIELAEISRLNYGNQMGLSEANDLIDQAQASKDKKAATTEGDFTFTLPELNQVRQRFINAGKEIAEADIEVDVASFGLNLATTNMLRLGGHDPQDSTNPLAALETIANDESIDTGLRTTAAESKAKIEKANLTQTPRGVKAELMKQANATMQKANEAFQKQQIALFPAEQEAAATDYFSNGSFTSATNAATMLVTNLDGVSSGSKYYDVAQRAFDFTNSDNIFDRTNKELKSDFLTGVQAGTISPDVALLKMIQIPSIRNGVSGQILAEARMDLYEETARSMGDDGLVAALNDPNSSASKGDQGLFQFLADRKAEDPNAPDISQYVAAVRASAFKFGTTAFKVNAVGDPKKATLQGSYAKILFQNQPVQQFVSEVTRQQFAAFGGLTREDVRRKRIRTQSFAAPLR